MTQEEYAVHLAEVEARCKSNTHRIDALEKSQEALHKLATAAEVMATEQKHQTQAMAEIKANVDSLTEKVEAVEQKPAKRWDGMVDKFLYGLAGVLAGALGAGLLYLLTVAA